MSENNCIGCGARLYGKYCHICGERKISKEDKKLKHFFEEVFSGLFYADGKFPRTLILLITRPGTLTHSFISGIRKKYLSPLQLFFFANLIYFLFPILATFNTSLNIQMYGLPYSQLVERTVENHLEKTGTSLEDFRIRYEKRSDSNGKLLLILLVLMQGILLRILFLKRKDLFLQDFMAAAAYFNSFYILIVLVAFPSIYLAIAELFNFQPGNVISESFLTVFFLVFILAYMFFFLRTAFNVSPKSALIRSLVFVAFMIPSFIVYRFILFWVTYAWVT